MGTPFLVTLLVMSIVLLVLASVMLAGWVRSGSPAFEEDDDDDTSTNTGTMTGTSSSAKMREGDGYRCASCDDILSTDPAVCLDTADVQEGVHVVLVPTLTFADGGVTSVSVPLEAPYSSTPASVEAYLLRRSSTTVSFVPGSVVAQQGSVDFALVARVPTNTNNMLPFSGEWPVVSNNMTGAPPTLCSAVAFTNYTTADNLFAFGMLQRNSDGFSLVNSSRTVANSVSPYLGTNLIDNSPQLLNEETPVTGLNLAFAVPSVPIVSSVYGNMQFMAYVIKPLAGSYSARFSYRQLFDSTEFGNRGGTKFEGAISDAGGVPAITEDDTRMRVVLDNDLYPQSCFVVYTRTGDLYVTRITLVDGIPSTEQQTFAVNLGGETAVAGIWEPYINPTSGALGLVFATAGFGGSLLYVQCPDPVAATPTWTAFQTIVDLTPTFAGITSAGAKHPSRDNEWILVAWFTSSNTYVVVNVADISSGYNSAVVNGGTSLVTLGVNVVNSYGPSGDVIVLARTVDRLMTIQWDKDTATLGAAPYTMVNAGSGAANDRTTILDMASCAVRLRSVTASEERVVTFLLQESSSSATTPVPCLPQYVAFFTGRNAIKVAWTVSAN